VNTTISHLDQEALGRAASLFDATGRSTKRGSVAIRCLLAAELLVQAGANPDPSISRHSGDRATLGEALRLLGGLSDDVLRDDFVLDAMHHALLAHAATR
jgi:hypothetical protein